MEGVIGQLVNRRLNKTGARWRPEHVGPLVELVDSPDWHEAWADTAARTPVPNHPCQNQLLHPRFQLASHPPRASG